MACIKTMPREISRKPLHCLNETKQATLPWQYPVSSTLKRRRQNPLNKSDILRVLHLISLYTVKDPVNIAYQSQGGGGGNKTRSSCNLATNLTNSITRHTEKQPLWGGSSWKSSRYNALLYVSAPIIWFQIHKTVIFREQGSGKKSESSLALCAFHYLPSSEQARLISKLWTHTYNNVPSTVL